MTIEEHPLEPFLPANAQMLFLGSFPPPQARWSMDFFYPNWINDFWRIQGLIHFGNKQYFELPEEKRFDKEKVVKFCEEKGIALFDTARKVCRLKDNAQDEFLEIIEGTDVFQLLEQMTQCRKIITTGGKASEELQRYLSPTLSKREGEVIKVPKVGGSVRMSFQNRDITWYRMPSSSRAYPMKLEKKAEYYKQVFEE